MYVGGCAGEGKTANSILGKSNHEKVRKMNCDHLYVQTVGGKSGMNTNKTSDT